MIIYFSFQIVLLSDFPSSALSEDGLSEFFNPPQPVKQVDIGKTASHKRNERESFLKMFPANAYHLRLIRGAYGLESAIDFFSRENSSADFFG